MRRRRKPHVLALVMSVFALLMSSWGTGVSLAAPSGPSTPAQSAGTETTAVQYGPYTIPAAASEDHHDHVHFGSQTFNIEKPCSDCYITKMTPALVNQAGEEIGLSTGTMLHHMVMLNADPDRTDATCGSSIPLGLLGQRFFASGDERTVVQFPPNHGYQIDNGAWNLIWEASNHTTQPQEVYFQVTFDWVPASQAGDMTDVEPVWFDADQCGDSEVSVPAGESSVDWTWNANRSGEMVSLYGHLHGNTMDGGGTHLTIANETTGELLCDSVAGYGDTPLSIDLHGVEWLSSMSACDNTEEFESFGHVSLGDQVKMTGHYDQNEPDDGQMAISFSYLADPPGDDPGDDPVGEDCSAWEMILGLCGGTNECNWLFSLLGWC